MGCKTCEKNCQCSTPKCGDNCPCSQQCKCACKNGPKEKCCADNN